MDRSALEGANERWKLFLASLEFAKTKRFTGTRADTLALMHAARAAAPKKFGPWTVHQLQLYVTDLENLALAARRRLWRGLK